MHGRAWQWAVAALLMIGLIAPAEAARKRKAAPRLEWDLSAGLTTTYNDNVIGLSERDRNLFHTSAALVPTPLETIDDLEQDVLLRPVVRWRAPHKLMVTADYRLRYVKRWQNDFTSYWSHNFALSLRPRVAESKWNLRFRVSGIPSFYLRVYKDRDYGQYHAARYANWDYEASFRYHVTAPLYVEAAGSFATYYYAAKFTEWDSEVRDGTGSVGYEVGRWRASAGYTRRVSDNIGKQQDGGIVADPGLLYDTEYGDADYSEDELNASVTAPLAFVKWRRVDFSLDYKFRRRAYLTDNPLASDPFHRGRLDKRGQLTGTLVCAVHRQLDMSVFMTYDSRGVDSPAPQVALAKDFVRREYGLQLAYSIR
jgi:hypothetical protein